ncbi:MAG: hypothetical protein WBV94_03935 [Blastocatellia bacterium]
MIAIKLKHKSSLVIATICFVTLTALAQDFEYGSAAELKGVTKIYVSTGTELDERNNIVKRIQKELPNIVVVDIADDAEVALIYGSSSTTRFTGWSSTSTSDGSSTRTESTPTYRNLVVGDGLVVKKGGGNRLRLLMQFGDTRKNAFQRKPSTNFAREFIKAYKKANPEGK